MRQYWQQDLRRILGRMVNYLVRKFYTVAHAECFPIIQVPRKSREVA